MMLGRGVVVSQEELEELESLQWLYKNGANITFYNDHHVMLKYGMHTFHGESLSEVVQKLRRMFNI